MENKKLGQKAKSVYRIHVWEKVLQQLQKLLRQCAV